MVKKKNNNNLLTEIVKLNINQKQKAFLLVYMKLYIDTVNALVHDILLGKLQYNNLSTVMFKAPLPSAIKCQCIRDAKSIINKYKNALHKYDKKVKDNNGIYYTSGKKKGKLIKKPRLPKLKTLVYYVNNQNYHINDDFINFPVLINNKSTRINLNAIITKRQYQLFKNKLGLLRITIKNGKLVACVQYELQEVKTSDNGNIMGIDIGLKCPAVSFDTNGKIRFFGNGRFNRYMRRKFFDKRKKLQRNKKYRVIKRIKNKESRIMKDINHKISRQIVNEAIAQDIKIIKLEDIKNIRKNITKRTTRTSRKNIKSKNYRKYQDSSRKNNRFVNSWSFGQLQKFIEYKAKKAGILVLFVRPEYTSKECPICHALNETKDRKYICKCGFHKHRDVVGAMNICVSAKIVGNRQSA